MITFVYIVVYNKCNVMITGIKFNLRLIPRIKLIISDYSN